jgi:hypothetical protein
MKRKPIRIDWEEIEAAFDHKDAELVYFVDRVTGHVVLEGQDSDDEEEPYGFAPGPVPPRNEKLHAYIEPLSNQLKLDWLHRFIKEATDLDSVFSTELESALGVPSPVEAVIEVLNRHPEGKRTWYAFRTDRLHEHIEAWVEAEGIAYTDPPPWRQ